MSILWVSDEHQWPLSESGIREGEEIVVKRHQTITEEGGINYLQLAVES